LTIVIARLAGVEKIIAAAVPVYCIGCVGYAFPAYDECSEVSRCGSAFS